MKIYRSPRVLLSEIKRRLAENHPSFHQSPLEDIAQILTSGRNYTWVGIYIAVSRNEAQKQVLSSEGAPHPEQMARPETRTKILVSIKFAGREIGVLDVESDRGNAFGSEDRVLMENVADTLARFLAGPGKYLARKAHNTAA